MANMKFTTDQFHYHKDDRVFTQEASTLQFPPGKAPRRIAMENPKTKGICIFEFLMTTRNERTGDIETFEYLSIAPNKDINLTIWND